MIRHFLFSVLVQPRQVLYRYPFLSLCRTERTTSPTTAACDPAHSQSVLVASLATYVDSAPRPVLRTCRSGQTRENKKERGTRFYLGHFAHWTNSYLYLTPCRTGPDLLSISTQEAEQQGLHHYPNDYSSASILDRSQDRPSVPLQGNNSPLVPSPILVLLRMAAAVAAVMGASATTTPIPLSAGAGRAARRKQRCWIFRVDGITSDGE